jgi:hypothetical protein
MGPFVMNTKREVLQAFEDFHNGLLGSIPATYKDDAKKPLNRSGAGTKLGGDSKAVDIHKSDVLEVHGAPTELQEG